MRGPKLSIPRVEETEIFDKIALFSGQKPAGKDKPSVFAQKVDKLHSGVRATQTQKTAKFIKGLSGPLNKELREKFIAAQKDLSLIHI